MQFSDLRLVEPILRAVVAEGYQNPTPIQAKAVPHVLAGRDVLGRAQTGTGKTAAFALPILQRLGAPGGRRSAVRALVLSPTRELALQIHESFRSYGRHTGLRAVVIYGGVGQEPQTRALRDGADILIATPGRLLDLMEQGWVDLRNIQIFVLDEADRMLDMGFIHDIRKVVAKLPRERQTLLFSATMPEEMVRLAGSILRNPERVEVTPQATAAETVDHSVYFVDKGNKPHLLRHFLARTDASRVLVFTRTKHGADRVVRHLGRTGVAAEAIHSNKSQGQRQRTLANFKCGRTTVLVATDIAARGIDVDDVSHVVNFDVPNVPETYVHRIGRTGRAGASGTAVSFCDAEERADLKAIERLLRRPIATRQDHPEYPARPTAPETRPAQAAHGSAHARRPFNGPRPPARHHEERPRTLDRQDHGAPPQPAHARDGRRFEGPRRERRRW